MKSPLSYTPIRLLKPDDESISAFERYGLHPKCLKCARINECADVTYNAQNVSLFYCANFRKK